MNQILKGMGIMMDLAKLTKIARIRYRQVVYENDIRGVLVPISCYLCDRDYKQVCDDSITFFEHWTMMGIFAEMVAKKGGQILFVPIEPADYFKWMEENGLKNNSGSRSRYVTFIITGKTDGIFYQKDGL
jgi:hypothetical protein